jgi:hypothetical protein
VALARRADVEGTGATLPVVGKARSILADWPIPAVPPSDLLMAKRAGSAEGLLAVCEAISVAGLSTAVGEAATAEARSVRCGVADGAAFEAIVGALEASARAGALRAICVEGLADGVAEADSGRETEGEALACRFTEPVLARRAAVCEAAGAELAGASETVAAAVEVGLGTVSATLR